MRREPHLTATRSSHDAVVTLEALTCGYHGRPVFWDVSLTLPAGQVIGLVGPTGSGKTTLLKAILGLVQPWRGRVCLFGRPVGRTARARLGYVPQVETLDWQFPVTAEQVVLMGAIRGWRRQPWAPAAEREAARRLMHQLGIGDCTGWQLRELSGGQQQRVFLARALMGHPEFLLLDEPTVGVDLRTQHDVLHLLDTLQARGLTILLTTHASMRWPRTCRGSSASTEV
jgi:zinc/manganese transport system ATP-binding protein